MPRIATTDSFGTYVIAALDDVRARNPELTIQLLMANKREHASMSGSTP